MESCKAGLENRINPKEAQETFKMLDKRATMPWNLVTKLAFRLVGYKARLLSSKLWKQEMWLSSSGLATLLATNISSLFQNCANEYLLHRNLCLVEVDVC